MVRSPARLGSKNNCAGEDQQQFTRATEESDSVQSHDSVRIEKQKNMAMGPAGRRTKNVLAKASSNLPETETEEFNSLSSLILLDWLHKKDATEMK
jgi:predicted RND superfamily exporter protein